MEKTIDVKYVYLNKNFEIVDANREFYVYFEKVSSVLRTIDDFVCPSNRNSLVKFLGEKNKSKKYKVFKFKKNIDNLKYNIATAFDCTFDGITTTCLKLIDIEEALSYYHDYHLEEAELLHALSITHDCIFSYWQGSNIFRLTQFHENNRVVLYEADIDEWCSSCIERQFIPSNQIEKFHRFIDTLKSCPKKIDQDLICSLRTTNPNVLEHLSFTGVRFVDQEEIMMCGRIMPIEDMAKAQQAQNIIEELQIDPLTKVYNKKTITGYAEKTFTENRDDNIALCIIDLDHFKPVNDAYGHMAGDKVLAKAGHIFQEIVGSQGYVGRYGGDEFLIVAFGMNSELMLRGFLHSIMIKIRDAFAGKFDDINITCSIGCSVYPKNGTTYDELFKKADFCLYRAKDKGRNRYVFFRDDLHGELYKKAIEAKAGVKYDDREIQELKFMSEFMQNVVSFPEKAIKDILQHMLDTYNLDNITIFYGPELKPIYICGKTIKEHSSAQYVNTQAFKNLLGREHHFRVDFMTNITEENRDFRTEMDSCGIKSTVQCILGTPDNIKGLVTFNRTKEASLWAEYEVNCVKLFSSSFNLLPESTKIDFALYSKL